MIGTKVSIKEFDLKNEMRSTPNPAIVILGKRGSGKSILSRDLIRNFSDIPVGIIISATEKVDPFFSQFFPDAFIYNEVKPDIFRKIMKRQVLIKRKQAEKRLQGKRIDTRILLMMDDCLASAKQWGKDELMKQILYDGRHFDITYILTMQSPLEIPSNIRNNFDYVFLFDTDIVTEVKKYHMHYAGMFPSYNVFQDFLTKLTTDYGIMVLKKRNVKSHNISSQVFKYKVKNLENPPMFGNKQLKWYHERNYDTDWKEKEMKKMIGLDIFSKKPIENKIQIIDVNGKIKDD
jgi:hypothetical protein